MNGRRPLTIVQVNSSDGRGGAARVALTLHEAYRQRGHQAWLVVGHKVGQDAHTLPLSHDRASAWWQRPFWRAEDALARRRFRGARWLRAGLLLGADPLRAADWFRGHEDFRFPGTGQLLGRVPQAVDVLHLHNLHGRYFDLGALPGLTRRAPTVLSLHDAWLMTGHCAHSFDCERWRTGCGHCPDLTIEPAIWRDATAENWQRKRSIYAASRFAAIAPSQWLADRAAASPLAAGLRELRVIPHGVDRALFRPGDRSAARRALGLPLEGHILVTAADGLRRNPWKDFATAQAAFTMLGGEGLEAPLLVLGIGDEAPEERLGRVTVRYLPHIANRAMMARYYQAADLFLNSSRVETFSLAVLEALACAIPVVATAVGGTPEQIVSWPAHDQSRANGMLVPAGDARAMAEAIASLLRDEAARHQLGRNAAGSVLDFEQQVDRTLAFYDDYLGARQG